MPFQNWTGYLSDVFVFKYSNNALHSSTRIFQKPNVLKKWYQKAVRFLKIIIMKRNLLPFYVLHGFFLKVVCDIYLGYIYIYFPYLIAGFVSLIRWFILYINSGSCAADWTILMYWIVCIILLMLVNLRSINICKTIGRITFSYAIIFKITNNNAEFKMPNKILT